MLHNALPWCCVQKLPAVILDFCWLCAFVYYCEYKKRKVHWKCYKKKSKVILSLWDFLFFLFFFACVCHFCVHQNYMDNSLCTVSKGLVLNAAVSSKNSNSKQCDTWYYAAVQETKLRLRVLVMLFVSSGFFFFTPPLGTLHKTIKRGFCHKKK